MLTRLDPNSLTKKSSGCSLSVQQCNRGCTKADTADILIQRTEESEHDRMSIHIIPCQTPSKDRMTGDHSLQAVAAAIKSPKVANCTSSIATLCTLVGCGEALVSLCELTRKPSLPIFPSGDRPPKASGSSDRTSSSLLSIYC